MATATRKIYPVVPMAIAFLAAAAAFCSVTTAAPDSPDTLVVCPVAWHPVLREWTAFRAQQQHKIVVASPPATAAELGEIIRNAYNAGRLRYVLLIGDIPSQVSDVTRLSASNFTPTSYVRAKVNVQWGSEPLIASDIPFADVDNDDVPDVAIGRIPAATSAQLSAVLRKTIDYEQKAEDGAWKSRLSIASGTGGFGAMTDAVIEAAARQVIQQNVPAEYTTEHISPNNHSSNEISAEQSFSKRARQKLSEGSLAWVYLGHGRPTELDHVRTSTGSESILSVRDVPNLHCGGHNPLAVLIACYTGAMDASRTCLAEELLLAKEGPVAVIAATRVTMPYGNIVLGCELLRSCFRDHPEHLGDALRLAEQKTLNNSPNDQLRMSLDSIAAGLSPGLADLPAERREHVLMYHLFGDPLLHLHYAARSKKEPADKVAAEP